MNLKQWIEDKIRENSWEQRLNEDSPYEDNASLIAKLSKVPKTKIKAKRYGYKTPKKIEISDVAPEMDEKKYKEANKLSEKYSDAFEYGDIDVTEYTPWLTNAEYTEPPKSVYEYMSMVSRGLKPYTGKEYNNALKDYLMEGVDEGFQTKAEAMDQYRNSKVKPSVFTDKDVQKYENLFGNLDKDEIIVTNNYTDEYIPDEYKTAVDLYNDIPKTYNLYENPDFAWENIEAELPEVSEYRTELKPYNKNKDDYYSHPLYKWYLDQNNAGNKYATTLKDFESVFDATAPIDNIEGATRWGLTDWGDKANKHVAKMDDISNENRYIIMKRIAEGIDNIKNRTDLSSEDKIKLLVKFRNDMNREIDAMKDF